MLYWFKTALKGNYLFKTTANIFNDVYNSSELAIKLTEQFEALTSMVGSEKNVLEIMHNRLADQQDEDEDGERNVLDNQLLYRNHLSSNIKYNDTTNKEIVQEFIPKSMPLLHVDLNVLANPNIMNRHFENISRKYLIQTQTDFANQMRLYHWQLIYNIHEGLNYNFFKAMQVKLLLIDQLMVMVKSFVSRGSSNNVFLPKCVSSVDKPSKDTNLKLRKPFKLNRNNDKINLPQSKRLIELSLPPTLPSSYEMSKRIMKSSLISKNYEEFLENLLEKNLKRKINVFKCAKNFKNSSEEELYRKNVRVLMDVINSNKNNLIKQIYSKQQLNKTLNYIRFTNFLKFVEIYTALSNVGYLTALAFQNYKKMIKHKVQKGLKRNICKLENDGLGVKSRINLLQPLYSSNLMIINEKCVYDIPIITHSVVEKIQYLKASDSFKKFHERSVLDNKLFGNTIIIRNRRFRMNDAFNAINYFLNCVTLNNSKMWLENARLLSDIKSLTSSESSPSSRISVDEIKARASLFEINQKVFDDTEVKLKIIEVLGKLIEKQRKLAQKKDT